MRRCVGPGTAVAGHRSPKVGATGSGFRDRVQRRQLHGAQVACFWGTGCEKHRRGNIQERAGVRRVGAEVPPTLTREDHTALMGISGCRVNTTLPLMGRTAAPDATPRPRQGSNTTRVVLLPFRLPSRRRWTRPLAPVRGLSMTHRTPGAWSPDGPLGKPSSSRTGGRAAPQPLRWPG